MQHLTRREETEQQVRLPIRRKKKKEHIITWKPRSRIQRDLSDLLPNILKNIFTSVPSFVPVSKPL